MQRTYSKKQKAMWATNANTAGTKPKKENLILCPDCGRPKQQFETEKKALNFIRWNSMNMTYGGETMRAYYCPSCCCWHVTHQQQKEHYDTKTENLLSAYERMRKAKTIRKAKAPKAQKPEKDLQTINVRAKEIFDSLPEEIKHWCGKGKIKKYLTEHKVELGITVDNETEMRVAIYNLWRQTDKLYY